MEKIIENEGQIKFQSLVSGAEKVVAVCHTGPDGDALGSTLAIAGWMSRLGKKADVVVPNTYPDFLHWMPGTENIIRYDKNPERAGQVLQEADLIFVCDLNAQSRLQDLENAVIGSPAARILIDHHLEPEEFCDVTISHPEMSATCEVLCHLLYQLGEFENITVQEATCLYTGMMTDTGAFTYNSNRSVVFECISRLIAQGIDKDRIYRNVFWTATPARMRLTGYLLYVKMELLKGLNASIMSLTKQERKLLGVKNGDTEGIVNMPLQISGMKLSILLTEDTEREGFIKFSLRSVDDFPCNEMSARFFNGGGHKNAAGGHLVCTIDEAIKATRKAINEYSAILRG